MFLGLLYGLVEAALGALPPPGTRSKMEYFRKRQTFSASEFAEFFAMFGGGFDVVGDADGDGELTTEEIQTQFQDDEKALQVATALDTSRDGALDKDEILAARRVLFKESAPLYTALDAERESYASQFLKLKRRSWQDSKALAIAWTPDEVSEIMRTFDADGDGRVDPLEVLDKADLFAQGGGDDDEPGTKEKDESSVISRFIKSFFFGYLTPAADARRMWSVFAWLECDCLDVEADTENLVTETQAPCLRDADLDRLLTRGEPTTCDFPKRENASRLTAKEFTDILTQGRQRRRFRTVVSVNDTLEDDLEDDIVLTFNEFRTLLELKTPAEIAGAISHLVDAGQVYMARTLLVREVTLWLEDDDDDDQDDVCGGAAAAGKRTTTQSDDGSGNFVQKTDEEVLFSNRNEHRKKKKLFLIGAPGSSFSAFDWTPPTTDETQSWEAVLRGRRLARVRAWVVPALVALCLLLILAYVATTLTRLDAALRDYDLVRAYVVGYLDDKDDGKRKGALDPVVEFLTTKPYDRGGLLPPRDDDQWQMAYDAGRALADLEDDQVDRRALAVSELAALLRQSRATDTLGDDSTPFRSSTPAASNPGH